MATGHRVIHQIHITIIIIYNHPQGVRRGGHGDAEAGRSQETPDPIAWMARFATRRQRARESHRLESLKRTTTLMIVLLALRIL